jgi:protocatechuate 3,4-dioxygenase beta subunit
MIHKHGLKRRNFLKTLAGGLGAAVVANQALAAGAACQQTPAQTAGPFYPGEDLFVPDNDLTRIPGRREVALGEVIFVNGVVRDLLTCQPIKDVNVEIWQACASGRYNNERDPNPAPLDPHFRYWGETFTDANGEYSFKTIKPGAYPADVDWDRPPHIHVRIAKRGYKDLITQLYFKGDPLNNVDKILQNVPARLRAEVIVDFQPNPSDPTSTVGVFNISIEKV